MTGPTEPSKGITSHPGLMGGAPCIKDTRLCAQIVANVAKDRQGAITVIDNWPFLSWNDIANARGWDRKGRPGQGRVA